MKLLPRELMGDEGFPVGWECSCGLTAAHFEFHAPACDRSHYPYIDEESLVVVEEAVELLVALRGSGLGDAGAALAALASLIAEAQTRIPDAVADARDQDFTWAKIATGLATTAGTVRRHYGDYALWRRTYQRRPCGDDR